MIISKTQRANSGNIYGNTPTYYNSLLQGYTDTTNGNISGTIDPMFVNPQMAGNRAPNPAGDYRLQLCNPVINIPYRILKLIYFTIFNHS